MGTYQVILTYPNGATPYLEEVGSCVYRTEEANPGN